MKLNPFSKVRTTSEIVATFDKTLVELQERIDLDNQTLEVIKTRKEEAIAAHARELAQLETETGDVLESHNRATRIHGKIADLIG